MKLKLIVILMVVAVIFLAVTLNVGKKNDARQELGKAFLLEYYSVSNHEIKLYEYYLIDLPKAMDSEIIPDTGIITDVDNDFEDEMNEKYSKYLDATEIKRLMMNRLLNDPVKYALSHECTLDVSSVEMTVYEEHEDSITFNYSVSINSIHETEINYDVIRQSGLLKITNTNEDPLITLTDITHLK